MSEDLALINRLLVAEVRRLEAIIRAMQPDALPTPMKPETALRMVRGEDKA